MTQEEKKGSGTVNVGGYRIDRRVYDIHMAIAKRCIAIDSYIREHPNYPDDIIQINDI